MSNPDIENLIEQMTLEEKVSMLAGADQWRTVAIERLGIPAIKTSDGPNGARGNGGSDAPSSVCTPVGVALGATWNPELVGKIGELLAEETRAKGAHILLAPTVNIHRTPLAGRNFECYSEDPYLTSRMAVAYIRGLQSHGVAACVKHYVCNDQEYERFSISAEVGTRPLREIYLPPFRAAIKEAGTWALMTAYNRVNGTYCSECPTRLDRTLREEWGYDGLVLSDWHGTYSSQAVEHGLDLEMPGPARWLGTNTVEAVRRGELAEEIIDEKVRHILKAIERVGAFDRPELQAEQAIDLPEHRKLTRQAAVESIVLLKNDDHLLPLQPEKLKTLAVIGAGAKWAAIMGGGSSNVRPHYVISPLQGIQDRLGEAVKVDYEIGKLTYRYHPQFDPSWLSAPDGGAGELLVEYFEHPGYLGKPVHTERTSNPNLTWYGYLMANLEPGRFSVRISGKFTAPLSGKYTFGLASIGRSKLYFDDLLLVDRWESKERMDDSEAPGTLEFTAGQSAELRIEYEWQGPERWRMVRLGCQAPLPGNLLGRAVDLAARSDAVIVFAGLNSEWESEGFDRIDMDLPAGQDELIQQVAAANPNTVVVLNCGSPVHMPWVNDVKSIVQAWYGGQEAGHAIADILFGDECPSGKLPTTFPVRVEDNPAYINYPGENGKVVYGEGIFVGYRYYDKKKVDPLFGFGHGLSYTQFEYRSIALERSSYNQGEEIAVTVTIRNAGERTGKEIVQLYLRDLKSRVMRPEKELKGFAKIELQAGESREVVFRLQPDDLAFYDEASSDWTVEAGGFEILVGASAGDIRLRAAFEVDGEESQTALQTWN